MTITLTHPAERTELANAQRFIDRHGANLRYVPPWGKWLVWDGRRWAIDDGCKLETLARDVVEEVWQATEQLLRDADRGTAAAMVSFAKATSSANGIAHFLHLAKSEPGVPIQPAELDRAPWLLNLENGALDLRTGVLRGHDKRDLITKLAPVVFDPEATCPRWRAFLAEITAADQVLQRYLARLVGLWLTGSVREHVLPILYGVGANGKSVFLRTVEALLGPDYAMHAPPDLLMVKRHKSHPTELADLFGKRLVTCVEAEAGGRLAESLCKELTGGDTIRARHCFEDFWQFQPTHKLVLACNHRPVVHGSDNGIWRRLRLVPFTVTIPPEKQDRDLPEKLLRELSGILNWALAGCLDWQAGGLQDPPSVLAATEAYRGEQDVLGEFLEDCCLVAEHAKVAGGKLYQAYTAWCQTGGREPDTASTFGRKLGERGFEVKKTEHGKVRLGIGLLAPADHS